LNPPAYFLTGMGTDVAENSGKGDFLPDHGYCLGKPAFSDKVDIAGNVNARGTGATAGNQGSFALTTFVFLVH
jgi:hypothetical protein